MRYLKDYIKDQKIKNVANKLLNIFAIIMPLITITGIYNFSRMSAYKIIDHEYASCIRSRGSGLRAAVGLSRLV